MTDSDPDRPWLTVVVNTYDGSAVLPRAIRSVLAQDLDGVELVVADDGSPVSPEALLADTFPGVDLMFVTHDNAGLSAARNLGAASASGDHLLFLDDDDELAPGAIEALRALVRPGVGIMSGGVEVREVGSAEPPWHRYPKDLGPEMEHRVASYLAGSFAISRDVLRAVGGFDDELRCNHQRELFLRAVPWCVGNGRSIVSTRSTVLVMHRRAAADRPRNEPARLQGCLERIVDKHRVQLGKNPQELALVLSNAGVAAARNDDLRSARAHLRDAVRVRPSEVRNLARLAAACLPPLARRVWGPVR